MSDIITTTGAPGNGGGGVPTLTDGVTPLAGPGTDFKAVAIGAGANIEPLTGYFTDPLLATGNLPGLAISAFNNRALRQGTFVASSLCQWISNQSNIYVPDDGSQINWITEFQNALSAFVLALIPQGPNLGLYLPLAGGTMVGNIQFQAGISTVLANNTWYFAKDTGGQPRGLIIKSSDNNVYVNDGTAPYVIINGTPLTGNNIYWSGRDTSNNPRPIVGFLSDNNIHIGGGVPVWADVGAGGSLWSSGNFVTGVNQNLYCRDSAGTARSVVGFAASSNVLQIGAGAVTEAHIYGGNGWVYLHSNVNPLGQLWVNGYTYMQAGGRAYIPSGNDPFQVYADYGYYARTHFIVGSTRDWSVGCLNNGNYAIADESAHAIRWQIDTSGNVTAYGSFTAGGNLYVDNGEVVYNGLTVYGSINVASGGASFGNQSLWNVWDVHISGGYYIGGAGYIYDGGGGQAGVTNPWWFASNVGVNGNLTSNGSTQVNGNLNCNNQTSSNTVITNYLQSNGHCNVAGNVTASYLYSSGDCHSWTMYCQTSFQMAGNNSQIEMHNGAVNYQGLNGYCPTWWSTRIGQQWGGAYFQSQILSWPADGQPLGQGWYDWSASFPGGFLVANNGNGYKPGGGMWADSSEGRLKKNIEDYDGGLEKIKKLRPRRFEFNGTYGHVDDGRPYIGLVVEEIEDVMPELLAQPLPWVDPASTTGEITEHLKTIEATPIVYALINAVKALAAKVEALEGRG